VKTFNDPLKFIHFGHHFGVVQTFSWFSDWNHWIQIVRRYSNIVDLVTQVRAFKCELISM